MRVGRSQKRDRIIDGTIVDNERLKWRRSGLRFKSVKAGRQPAAAVEIENDDGDAGSGLQELNLPPSLQV